jgi:two-component system phosphate regulon response regulator PhoB
MTRILIVEDEPDLQQVLEYNLRQAGHEVFVTKLGREGLRIAKEQKPEVVLLDLMLPDLPGTEVCKQLKEGAATKGISVIMLTARGEEIDRVVGFELGADDYVTKPFSVRELLARLRALLRRSEPAATPAAVSAPEVMRFGKVEVDSRALRGKRGKEAFELTPRELKVLALLHQNRGHVVARENILNEVWGIEYYGTTRTLDQLILKLRQKIEETPGEPRHLLTVHGFGYRLEE